MKKRNSTRDSIAYGIKSALILMGIAICAAAAVYVLRLILWIGYAIGIPM